MAALQGRLSVALIATPRDALCTCDVDEPLSAVMARNSEPFDFFPVTRTTPAEDQRIVGLLDLVPYLHGKPAEGIVRDQLIPLSEEYLIGADAGILDFVRNADSHRCRLVLSGSQVSGLVNLSDLQKLPVRAALFAMVTQLEMTMAEAIGREFRGSDGWKQRLSCDRLEKVTQQRERVKADDNLVDELLFTQFGDKVTIIRKSEGFVGSKSRFCAEMADAQRLRDDLAHANEYAATRQAAIRVCEAVRRVESWIDQLSRWPEQAERQPV